MRKSQWKIAFFPISNVLIHKNVCHFSCLLLAPHRLTQRSDLLSCDKSGKIFSSSDLPGALSIYTSLEKDTILLEQSFLIRGGFSGLVYNMN